MLNKCMFIGNLGRDPEIRHTQSGDAVANLSLATTERWKDKNSGEKRERTEWVRVVIFGPVAKIAEQYLRKGSKIYIEGSLQTRKWQDQQGNDKYSTEVVLTGFGGKLVMLDGKQDGGDGGQSYGQATRGGEQTEGFDAGPEGGGDLDDEIPFAPETRL